MKTACLDFFKKVWDSTETCFLDDIGDAERQHCVDEWEAAALMPLSTHDTFYWGTNLLDRLDLHRITFCWVMLNPLKLHRPVWNKIQLKQTLCTVSDRGQSPFKLSFPRPAKYDRVYRRHTHPYHCCCRKWTEKWLKMFLLLQHPSILTNWEIKVHITVH